MGSTQTVRNLEADMAQIQGRVYATGDPIARNIADAMCASMSFTTGELCLS